MRFRKKHPFEDTIPSRWSYPLKYTFNVGGHFLMDVFIDGQGIIRNTKRTFCNRATTLLSHMVFDAKDGIIRTDTVPAYFAERNIPVVQYKTTTFNLAFLMEASGYPDILQKIEGGLQFVAKATVPALHKPAYRLPFGR